MEVYLWEAIAQMEDVAVRATTENSLTVQMKVGRHRLPFVCLVSDGALQVAIDRLGAKGYASSDTLSPRTPKGTKVTAHLFCPCRGLHRFAHDPEYRKVICGKRLHKWKMWQSVPQQKIP